MRRYEANSCWRQFIELQAELSNWQPGIKDLHPFIARSRRKTAVAHFRFRTRQKKKKEENQVKTFAGARTLFHQRQLKDLRKLFTCVAT